MNDVAQLKKDQLLEVLAQKDELLVQQHERIEVLEQMLRQAVSKQYGSQSEKVSADQLALLGIPTDPEIPKAQDDEQITVTYKRKRGKRGPCDKELARHRIDYELPENERQCDCGDTLQKIGEVTSEQYEFIPAQYIVLEHVQHQYGCACCKSKASLKLAPKPPQLLPRTNAAAGLLAYIATTKYVDSVPLHRQEKQHARNGLKLPRNTMARWLMQLADIIMPLINLFEDAIRAGPYTQCDETPYQVLKEAGRKATTKSYIWVRHGGLPGQEVVLYNYFPSRSSEVVTTLFEDYDGYVQCDGYAAYNVLEKQGVTLIGCAAHARRKFREALKTLPNKEAAQRTKAGEGIQFFKRLYAIETEARLMSVELRYTLRQEKSAPILKEFKAWLDAQVVLPKSPMGKAVNYTLNQWPRLIRYCDDGILEIDNNRDERAVRPLAIGRRNFLFSDTPKGAHTNARFYSLIETCKLHGHEPYAYLKYFFKELPKVQSLEGYESLLPWQLDVDTVNQVMREV